MKVAELMQTDVKTVDLDATVGDAITRLASSSRFDAISVRCAPAGACGPKCVMKIVSARHPATCRRLSRQASRSMSGGGVGGMMKPPGRSRMPAVSPTKATPVSALK